MRRSVFIAFLAGVLFALWVVPVLADSGAGESGHGSDSAAAESKAPAEHGIPEFFVPPPPFSEDIFPCSDCHEDMDVNPERRELEDFHEEIQIINHNESERWCLDCHNPDNRDVLRLVNGKLISFEESYFLCGQCHGTIFRDWKAGIHGRRTGEWNGKKTYRLCVHCHNPHQPRFQPLAPKPPPIKPKDIR
jgi:hypothetical protein